MRSSSTRPSSIAAAATPAPPIETRHGHEDGSVTLGGRRVPIQRPRVRATDGSGEVAISTYARFAEALTRRQPGGAADGEASLDPVVDFGLAAG